MQAPNVLTAVCMCVHNAILSLFSDLYLWWASIPWCIASNPPGPWCSTDTCRRGTTSRKTSFPLPSSGSPKRTSAQCDPGHSGSPFFLINMHSKDEVAKSNQHWKRAKRKRDREHTRAHRYIQSLTCTNKIDFLRKISLQANH